MTVLDDRYEVLGLLATGGMASVLYGRLRGPAGFAREVAIKRLHPHFAREPEFLSMFVDEARICARLSHANIVSALDVIDTPPDLCLVMEYVAGAGLDVLLHAARSQHLPVPVPIAIALVTGVLHGLHAAHEARGEGGEPLQIVHRDVSPSNVLVGEDGVPRVLDFGIARAVSKLRTTPNGEIKGKFPYMAPELLRGESIDRRFDVYSAAVILWELLVGRQLFAREPSAAIVKDVLAGEIVSPCVERSEVSQALGAIVLQGLANDPAQRFASAHEFAQALERASDVARQSEVASWVRALAGALLEQRAADLRRLGRERTEGRRTQIKPAIEREDELLDQPTIVQERRSVPPPLPVRTLAAPMLAAPTPEVSSMRRKPAVWLVGALAVLVLGGALHAGASQRKTSEAPPQTRPTASVLEVPPSPAPAPVLVPAPEPAMPSVPPVETIAAGAAAKGARSHASKLTTLHTRAKRPAKLEPVTVTDDCAQTFQLEQVNGVMIKTFKPGCL